MIVSTVKQYNTHTINKRRAERDRFGTSLSDVTDVDKLKAKVLNALSGKGTVYGIYKKKELVGIYIFNRINNYFVKTEGTGITLGERKVDLEQIWYGDNTTALKLTEKILKDETADCISEIEKDIRLYLREQIEFGPIAGIEWEDELIYSKRIAKANRNTKYLLGYLGGFLLGLFMGWQLFDSLPLGICFGASYATLWGGVGIATARSKVVWMSYDFINKESHEEAPKEQETEE